MSPDAKRSSIRTGTRRVAVTTNSPARLRHCQPAASRNFSDAMRAPWAWRGQFIGYDPPIRRASSNPRASTALAIATSADLSLARRWRSTSDSAAR